MFDKKHDWLMWGAGTYGKRILEYMQDELSFVAIIDNDATKHGEKMNGVPVIGFDQAKEKYPNAKIVLGVAYPNVLRSHLLEQGYREYEDYITVYDFIPRWFKAKYDELAVMVANFSPASLCTLSCEGCQSFIPYLKNGSITPVSEMIEDADLLFSNLDRVFLINICLGESFINRELSKFVRHVYDHYKDKYGYMVILTNGTIVPADSELQVFADCGVTLSISDYRWKDEKIGESLKALVGRCKKLGVRYYLNTSSDTSIWFDFGNPLKITSTNESVLIKRFTRCFKCGAAIRKGNILMCEAQNAAIAVAEVPGPENGDYYDMRQPMTDESRKALYKIISRNPDKGYISHCARCNGTTPIHKET